MDDFLPQHGASPGSRMRALLRSGSPLVVPGAYDALSARLVEAAGFDCVYMTGYGTSASLLGLPDIGLVSQAEMVDNARRMSSAIDVPLISDADTGFGNALNVARTVREFERAGVAAIHLEDQLAPKRCGHMAGKEVVPVGEMVEKVHAAVAARSDSDFVLIARTDARAVEGLDSALERAAAYHEAGADVLFIEAPESESEVAAIADAFPDVPLLFNWVERGRSPMLPLETLAAMGFSVVIMPVATLFSATAAMQRYLEEIRLRGTPLMLLDHAIEFEKFGELMNLPAFRSFEERVSGLDA
jgi:2-methylisocitrate lyase-like PEP mutase family enzyme